MTMTTATSLGDQSPEEIVRYLRDIGDHPAADKIEDGIRAAALVGHMFGKDYWNGLSDQDRQTWLTAVAATMRPTPEGRDYERGHACGWYDMMAKAGGIAAEMGHPDVEAKIRSARRIKPAGW